MEPGKESHTTENEVYATGTAASGQTGNLSGYTKEEADAKFKDINYVLLGVVIILLVMVATLIIDSFHINSATYKEYSEKTKTLEDIQNINKELLGQNKQNQELILKQQKQILDIFKK